MCNTSEDVQYKRGCDVRRDKEHLQYNLRKCSTNQAQHQYKQGCVVEASRSSSSGRRGHHTKILSNE